MPENTSKFGVKPLHHPDKNRKTTGPKEEGPIKVNRIHFYGKEAYDLLTDKEWKWIHFAGCGFCRLDLYEEVIYKLEQVLFATRSRLALKDVVRCIRRFKDHSSEIALDVVLGLISIAINTENESFVLDAAKGILQLKSEPLIAQTKIRQLVKITESGKKNSIIPSGFWNGKV